MKLKSKILVEKTKGIRKTKKTFVISLSKHVAKYLIETESEASVRRDKKGTK